MTLIACALMVLVFAFLSSVYEKFLMLPYLEHNIFVWIGMAVLLFSLGWVLLAQSHMRKSWRIGIDEDAKAELVDRGLFKISRNPNFLGMHLMLLGMFLILPNAVMLTLCVAGEILIQIQVRLEEEYLTRIHGDSYIAYQKHVRRWI